jgi:1-acyl-sn-glycerol-3-phosphate acyltransferase
MFRFLNIISNVWLRCAFIFPKKLNTHFLLETETYIIIANHASFLDAPALYSAIPVLFKTLGKEEMAKIPIFKYIYTSAVVTVNRGSTMARAKSFLQMQQEVEDGLNVVFFPEGTFDGEQNELKKFFDGAFHMAIKTKKKILPLLLVDTQLRMHPTTIWGFTPGVSRTVFLPAISTNGLGLAETDNLKTYCYNYMNTILQYCKKNNIENYNTFITEYITKHPFTPNVC